MTQPPLQCPYYHCQKIAAVRNGKNRSGSQTIGCKACGRFFTESERGRGWQKRGNMKYLAEGGVEQGWETAYIVKMLMTRFQIPRASAYRYVAAAREKLGERGGDAEKPS